MIKRAVRTLALLAFWGASAAMLSHGALAGDPTPAAPAAPSTGNGPKAKGYLSTRYSYVGSSSAATVSSGIRITGSFAVSALSDRISLRYRSYHWFALEHPEKHLFESAFQDRSVVQTVALETDGLLHAGLKTSFGRLFPDMDYASSPAIDGGALAFELGGFSIDAAVGRPVDLWNSKQKTRNALVAGQVKYRAERLSLTVGFQEAAYAGVRQKEAPTGFNVMLDEYVWLEGYGAYDFEAGSFAREGVSLSWRGDDGSLSIAASLWRNPLDQFYLADKGKELPYWGLYSRPAPATYRDVRMSGSYGRSGWSLRGTLGLMADVRSGWTLSTYLMAPSFFGFRVGAGTQAMKSDFIEFYSAEGLVNHQVGRATLQLDSQIRNYEWRGRPSGLHNTDEYTEISIEYPFGRHLHINAAAGGTSRRLGDEGFKPQANLRLIARI